MKKRLLYSLLFCLFILPNVLSAQDWAPIGAKWHFSHGFSWAPYELLETLEVQKDTIISSRPCKKLIHTKYNSIGNFLTENLLFLSDSNSTLSYFDLSKGAWNLLYDFNKQEGDTIFYPWNNEFYIDTVRFYTIVDSVYTVSINGAIRNAQDLSQGYDSANHLLFLDWFGGTVIEGIGRINHSFFPTPHNTDEFGFEPRCYEDSIMGRYEHPRFLNSYPTSQCEDVLRVGLDDQNNSRIKVFPNPATSKIYFSGIKDNSIIVILDSHGKVVLEKEIEYNQAVEINKLTNGIYFIEIINSDRVIRKKFIKSN